MRKAGALASPAIRKVIATRRKTLQLVVTREVRYKYIKKHCMCLYQSTIHCNELFL
uniref:Uncharacterized protein n=1 Tax=Ciona intestinalis TaxID=7719 RepID=H2XSY4_CIOIN